MTITYQQLQNQSAALERTIDGLKKAGKSPKTHALARNLRAQTAAFLLEDVTGTPADFRWATDPYVRSIGESRTELSKF